MPADSDPTARSGPFRGLTSLGGRAATLTLRPFTAALGVAAGAGREVERRAVDRVLESDDLERVLVAAVDSAYLQHTVDRVLASDGVRHVVDSLFDSGLFDHIVDKLLEGDALWRLIDEVVQSPAVMAAVSGQGLGFADQVGDEVRRRSGRADTWLAEIVRRRTRREAPRLEAPAVVTDASALTPGGSAVAPSDAGS
jgi:hypothetical protein